MSVQADHAVLHAAFVAFVDRKRFGDRAKANLLEIELDTAFAAAPIPKKERDLVLASSLACCCCTKMDAAEVWCRVTWPEVDP